MGSQGFRQGFDPRSLRVRYFLFFLLVLPLSATNYYVDCAGNDSNDGTSTTAPWRTVAKVNGSSFSAGDTVFFKSDCVWREQLTVPSSGDNGNPFKFDAYGTGNLPLLTGADLLSSWTLEGDVYYSAASAQANQVFSDGKLLTQVSNKALLASGTWWWDWADTRVYVHNNPAGHSIEASQRNYGIFGVRKSYITIANLEADKTNAYGIYVNVGDGLSITNVGAQNNADTGVRVDQLTSSVISYSTAAYNGANGFAGFASPGLLFDHLTAHHNSFDTTKVDTAGINLTDLSTGYWPGTAKTATKDVVQYSESYANGAPVCCSHGIGIWADTIGDNLTVRYNYAHDNNGIGIYAEKDSQVSVFANVVVRNNAPSGDVQGGIVLYMDCNNPGCNMAGSLVANNVVYNNGGHGLRMMAQNVANGCTGNQVTDNIAVSNGWDDLDAESGCENLTDGSQNTYTYNSFGPAAANFIQWGKGTTYSTYAAWETATGSCGSVGCSRSVQGDPMFTNATAGDFTLQPGSPAIHAGVPLSQAYLDILDPRSTFPWNTMRQGNNGSAWDVGAFVFIQNTPPEPPAALSVVVR